MKSGSVRHTMEHCVFSDTAEALWLFWRYNLCKDQGCTVLFICSDKVQNLCGSCIYIHRKLILKNYGEDSQLYIFLHQIVCGFLCLCICPCYLAQKQTDQQMSHFCTALCYNIKLACCELGSKYVCFVLLCFFLIYPNIYMSRFLQYIYPYVLRVKHQFLPSVRSYDRFQ